ncbi:hypothetical protein N8I77_008535 [Diaporthe amygdali]|uniref:Uncharacterized protein n=1 Tax=Phomopsis amygdali TaxID=1214568 RepID=A0AAD9SFC9_PHOAM|nr:hypothetical protein N8I77_008535 [Diaporthe amygdali]
MDDLARADSKDRPYQLSARGMLETEDRHFFSVAAVLSKRPPVQILLTTEIAVEPAKWGELQTLTT